MRKETASFDYICETPKVRDVSCYYKITSKSKNFLSKSILCIALK